MKRGDLNVHNFFWCTRCRKKTWRSRKHARRMARRNHPDDHTLAAYSCPVHEGGWHYGHHTPWIREHHRRQP